MTEIATVALENEMDLIVAHKRLLGIGSYLKLTVSCQTGLATAVVEIGRELLVNAVNGRLAIGITQEAGKNFISAAIRFTASEKINATSDGLVYARKLIPMFSYQQDDAQAWINMQVNIPRTVQLSTAKINLIVQHFKELGPATPYEELLIKNTLLHQLTHRQDQQLRQSQSLDERKNEFISIASHELKTPLTTIKAYSQLAMKMGAAGGCNPQVMGFMEKIDMQCSKLQRLIQQLLDMSTIENGKLDYTMEDVDFGAYMAGIMEVLSPTLANHHLHLHIGSVEAIVYMDKLRIEQVFTNLVNNAAKYSQPGTNIYIECSIDEQGMKKVVVRDEGIGMSKGNLDQIFEKFFREERAIRHYSGLGMGLYITRNIVEEHGGKIWAESEQGVGSSFCFTLPVKRIINTNE